MVKKRDLQQCKLKKRTSPLGGDKRLEVISFQITIIKNSLRSLVYFRELDEVISKEDHFWRATKFAHLQHFATGWCMCFGSKYTEKTHWKSTSSGHSEFKQKLLLHVNMSAMELDKYVKAMLAVRNKLLSHIDVGKKVISIPNFDTAVAAHVFLYDYLRKELVTTPQLTKVDVLSIEMWMNNLTIEAEKVIKSAHSSTMELAQNY